MTSGRRIPIDEVEALARQGLTCPEIAMRLGFSANSVWVAATRAGLDFVRKVPGQFAVPAGDQSMLAPPRLAPIDPEACRRLWGACLRELLREAFGISGGQGRVHPNAAASARRTLASPWGAEIALMAGTTQEVVLDFIAREDASPTPGATLKTGQRYTRKAP